MVAETTPEKAPSSLVKLREDRLDARLAELTNLIEYKESDRDESTPQGQAKPECLRQAKASVEDARAALAMGKDQVAWAHCHQSFRFLIGALDDNELESRRRTLRREAADKLNHWRREAVLDVLGRDIESTQPFTRSDLSLAQFMLDEHFGNVYFKLEAVAIRVRKLPWLLAALIIVLLVPSFLVDAGDSGVFLFDTTRTALVMLAGLLGATLSSTMSVLGIATRIPNFVGEVRSWLVRPLLGALSAVALVLIIDSGLLPLAEPGEKGLYAWALVAGFSDQVLNKVMQQVEKRAES